MSPVAATIANAVVGSKPPNLVEVSNYLKRGNQTINNEMTNNLLTSIKALFKADHGSTVKIPDTINDILLLYDVGTEKAKFRQLLNPSQHTTILGPLRLLDLSSATSKARKIMNNNNVRSERENETKTDDEQVQSIMNKTTYRIILD